MGYIKKVILFLLAPCAYVAGLAYMRTFYHRPEKPALSNLNVITISPTDNSCSLNGCMVQEAVNHLQTNSFSPCKLSLGTDEYIARAGVQVSPENKTIVITSRGYAYATKPKPQTAAASIIQFPRVGGGLICAANWIKYVKITCPVICFDYYDDWNNFDFGLTHDSDCLSLVIDEVLKQSPDCSIILIGTCKGSRSILHYLLQKNVPENIKAVILDAPFPSVSDLCKAAHRNIFKWVPYGHKIAYKFVRWWFPNYHPAQDLPYHIRKIPRHIPILIGHLKNDLLVQDTDMQQFVSQMDEYTNSLYVCMVSHPTIRHSKLSHMRIFQQIANAFLAKHNLPHDTELAQKGSILLPITQYNSHNSQSWITLAELPRNS